jgi:5-(aminomethyl)-3-furanmethanol phosphate kinase
LHPLTVVKVGGSLFDLPELGPRLKRWLDRLSPDRVLLVPGGGKATDVIRELDARHGLGEERSHWLALRALALNAYVLGALLPGSHVVESFSELDGSLAILDPLPFCLADERYGPSSALKHTWNVTSDSIAARVAVVAGAQRLILLKSVDISMDMTWDEAARRGYVDVAFADTVRAAPALEVRLINFRNESA